VASLGERSRRRRIALRARSMLLAFSSCANEKRNIVDPASAHSSIRRAPTAATVISVFLSSWRCLAACHARRETYHPPTTAARRRNGFAAESRPSRSCRTNPMTSDPPERAVAMRRPCRSQNRKSATSAPRPSPEYGLSCRSL
jgi:hypothetical protein